MPQSRLPHLPIRPVAANGKYALEIYGRRFSFDPGSAASRGQAQRDAEAFGQQRQETMTRQVGRPLTKREQISGVLERPPAPPKGPTPCGVVANDPNLNPYDSILARLNRDAENSLPSDRGAIDRRLKMYTRLQAEWNDQHAREVAAEQHDNDKDVIRARDHARTQLERLRNDPTALPVEIHMAEDRKKIADSSQSVGAYWTACRADGVPADSPAESS